MSRVPGTATASSVTSGVDPRLAVTVLCFGGLITSLAQTLVLPIQGELPVLLDSVAASTAWVVTVTLLAGAVAMPIAGRLADLFGKQRVLVVSALVLVAGLLVCGLSDTLAPMLVGRALQGLAMGFVPVGISLMREIVPPQMAGSAMAAMSATLGVGGAVGLPLSAWIVQVGDWHAIFWLAAVLAAAVAALSWFAVPHVHDAQPGRLDVVGALGLALGLVGLLVGISQAPVWGWGDPRTLGSIVAGVVVLVVWGLYELRSDDALVDLRASAELPVLMTNVAAVAVGFGMLALSIVVPQLLQLPTSTGYGLGQSVLAAGLWLAPGGLVMMVFSPISGRLINTMGARVTLMVGAAVLGVGYLGGLLLMDAPWQLLVASCVTSAGVGIAYAAMPTLVLDAVPPRVAGSAVGVNALMRSIGTTLAAAVMGTILTSSTRDVGGLTIPTERAFEICFVVGAAAAFLGVAIAATIPRRRAAAPADELAGSAAHAG